MEPSSLQWNGSMLRVTPRVREPWIAAQKKKLASGVPISIAMRAYVFDASTGRPITVTTQTCKVSLDAWNDVYEVAVNGGLTKTIVTLEGVLRHCLPALDVIDRSTLGAKPAFVGIGIDVDPDAKLLVVFTPQGGSTPQLVAVGSPLYVEATDFFCAPVHAQLLLHTGAVPP